MVADQGQVLVVLAPRDLVNADLDQPGQPVRVQLLRGHPLTHRPDGAPGHPGERGHRGLVRPGGQPHHQVLEVSREARPGPGERDGLGEHAVLRAVQAAPAHHQPTLASAQVKVPPPGVHPSLVVGDAGREVTARAGQPAPPGGYLNDHRTTSVQVDVDDPDPIDPQQAVE